VLHKKALLLALFTFLPNSYADTGSKLLATGGITGFEGASGGGITPWAFIGGYGTQEEINGSVNIQDLSVSQYNLQSVGANIGFYDRVELGIQKQTLSVSSGITSNVFSLLTEGAVGTAPGTTISQDIVNLKVKVFGEGVFAQHTWLPQIAVGAQHKTNNDFDTSLALPDGTVPLPNTGVPMLLGAKSDSGTDYYVSATKLFLGAAGGYNLLVNATARMTKANTFGLLGFGSAQDDDYELEWEGSIALLQGTNSAIGFEWRTQTDRLGGLAEEDTVYDVFVAYFPSKSVSLTAAYVDLGNLPYQPDSNGFYLSVTANY